MGTKEEMLNKVRGLMAKAESTNSDAERQALIAKATALMTKYDIDEALLNHKQGVREEVDSKRITYADTRYYKEVKNYLWHAVQEGAGVKVVLHSGYAGEQEATIVGFGADIAWAELLYFSLWTQLYRAATEAYIEADRSSDKRRFINSFARGFINVVERRLMQGRRQAVHEADQGEAGKARADQVDAPKGAALVLAAREDEVEAAKREKFPNLKKPAKRVKYKVNFDAYGAGQQAGRTAAIGRPGTELDPERLELEGKEQ